MLNGQTVIEGVDLSPTLVRLPSGGLSVGRSRRSPVSQRYAGRGSFVYTGHIDHVHIEPGPQPPNSAMVLDESVVQARMRAAAAAK